LPGAGGRAEAWQGIAERLAKRRSPIFCRYPGLGGAPPAPRLATLSDLIQHLSSQLPERFDLAAMSMGGVIALLLALEQPERVRRLVLLATSGGIDVAALGALEWRETFVALEPDAPRWFLDDRTDLSARLAEVRQPALLIFGDADLIAPVAIGQALELKMPHSRLEAIAGATHDLQQEHPDLIASLIEAHLRR
jgi:pimeloyl-ACP methyl ester carboxylesterase